MGVFTFVCKQSGGDDWSAKQLNGEVESSGASAYELQRNLVQAALSADSSGTVESSFSYVTPSSAVFQVIVGGSVGGGAVSSTVAPAASSSNHAAPAEEKKPAEKEEEKEEESDEESMFSLFD